MGVVDDTFMMKIAWEVFGGECSLWSQVLRGNYLNNSSLNSSMYKSNLCKDVSKVWDTTSLACAWALGDGSEVRFQLDQWLPIDGRFIDFLIGDVPLEWHNLCVTDFVSSDGNLRWEDIANVLP